MAVCNIFEWGESGARLARTPWGSLAARSRLEESPSKWTLPEFVIDGGEVVSIVNARYLFPPNRLLNIRY